ncbi:MAG: hypothetical protein JJ913_04865 [Rhizobiaceae bacterium]|nr:hypothetical protein [Rhizobiaceae bacterium]
MKNRAGRARRVIVSSIAVAASLAAAGCTGGSSQQQAPGSQPRVATYRCGDGDLRIINTGGSVVVDERVAAPLDETAAPGEAPELVETRFELVAAPPNQRSRYGAEGLALVLEGNEALWMKAGRPPMTCNR